MKVVKDFRGEVIIEEAKDISQMFISTSYKPFTFRGMYYQTNPRQIKKVKIVNGSIIDFLYNIETKEVKIFNLNTESDILVIDREWAHGYFTLEPNTILGYTMVGEFNPETYTSLSWKSIPKVKDKILSVCSEDQIIISEKDNI